MTPTGFLVERGITGTSLQKVISREQTEHDRTLYRQRHKIANMFIGSRAGDAFTQGTTDAPIRSYQKSASQPSSFFG
jgi:hypothetical protein